MVAIVSGNSLGLINSSAGVLGQQGMFGSATHGASKEGAYVNIANGNLSLQDGDNFLAANGINLALTRTYNSQAVLSDANNNGWQDLLLKQVSLKGLLNDSLSYVERTNEDGSVSVFKYKGANVYVSQDGGGAYQTLTFTKGTSPSLGTWTWTADRTDQKGLYEVYDMDQGGYIVKAGDQVGVRLNYTYTKLATSPATYQISKVTDATGTGDSLTFSYSGTNLTGVLVTPGSSGGLSYSVSYAYDAQNRLKSVTIDLTPQIAGDNTAQNLYTTIYTYEADVNGKPSQNVASIVQSDGTRLEFTYQNGRVKTYTLFPGGASTAGSTTTFEYDQIGRTTTVTDPLNHKVTYAYDSNGQLLSAETQDFGKVSYTYDSVTGDVLTMTDPRGLVTEYRYDANGNRTEQHDAAGNSIVRKYATNGSNLLLSETTYLVPSDNWSPAQPQTTRYVYDAYNRLRFQVSPQGRVTEYIYPSPSPTQVQYSSVRQFNVDLYAGSDDLATAQGLTALASWTANKTAIKTDYAYNSRGLLQQASVTDGTTTVTTQYTYNPSGQVLTSKDDAGNTTTYAYDGLGRQLSKVVTASGGVILSSASTTYTTDTNGSVTLSIVTETRYTAGAKTNGAAYATNTYTYDRAGELLSVQQKDIGGQTIQAYDADGQLRMVTTPGGQKTYYLYDTAGRRTAEIDANGFATKFVYNPDNQLIHTIRYSAAVDTAALSPGDDGKFSNLTADDIFPEEDGEALHGWRFYDKAGRLIDTVDALGYVTHYVYDGASRLLQVIARDKPVDTAALVALSATGLAQMTGVTQTTTPDKDRSSYKLYDKDGLLTGQIDALGYLTEYSYNAAGLLIDTIRYATKISATPTAATVIANVRPASGDSLHNYRIYDTLGRLSGMVDSDGYLTELAYDNVGNIKSRTTYAFASTTPAATTLAGVKSGMTAGSTSVNVQNSPDNRVVTYTYTGLGQLKTEVTSAPGTASITYDYDSDGNLVKTTRNNGSTSVASYDAQGHVLTEAESDKAPNTVYTYDADGRRTSMTDPAGNLTTYYYDQAGRLSYTVDGSGSVLRQQYDNFGRVARVTRYATVNTGADYATRKAQLSGLIADGSQTTSYGYDADGRLIYTIAPDNTVTGKSYNAYGQLSVSVSYGTKVSDTVSIEAVLDSTTGNKTSYYKYDGAGRLTYAIDPAGNVTGKTYDDFGRVYQLTRYTAATTGDTLPLKGAAGSTETYLYNKRGLVTDYADGEQKHTLTAYDAYGRAVRVQRVADSGGTDSITRTIYDEDGRVAATIDPLGALTVFQYNGDGNVTDRITYATPLTGANLTAIDRQLLNGLTALSTSNTIATSDLVTVVKGMAVAKVASDLHQVYRYDNRGRQVLTATAIPPAAATATSVWLWSITTQAYDNNDQVIERISYATQYSATLANMASTTATITPAIAASDARVRLFYDQDGRVTDTLTAQGTGAWAVASQQYDAFGNVTQQTAFSAVLSAAAPTASDLATFKASNAAARSNAVTAFSYDNMNRVKLRFVAQNVVSMVVNGSMTDKLQWAVHENTYDVAGDLSDTIDYATTVLTAPGKAPTAAPAAAPASDRTTAYKYDGAHRPVKITDALGAVTLLEYDARGNVIKRTEKGSASDRVTRTQYDLNDRPKLVADASGAVTELRYDAFGNVVNRIQYATRIKATDALVAPASDAANDRSTIYVYDQDQQLRFTVDGSGFITENRYDALGRVLQRLTYPNLLTRADNKLATLVTAVAGATGANAPRGTVYTYDAQGNVSSATDALNFVEKYTYDALGRKLSYTNQLSNTWNYSYDGAGRILTETAPSITLYPAGSTAATAGVATSLVTAYKYDTFGNVIARTEAKDTNQTRTTTYGYDLVGHQVQTTLPAVAAYSATAAADGTGRTETAAVAQSVIVTYDMLGNAIASTDVGGATSYKVYDKLGQVRYDIDALGYVTGYERNQFGDVITLTRYADKLPGYDDFIKDTSKLTAAAVKDAMVARKPAGPDRAVVTEYDQMGRASKVTEPQVTVYDQYGINGQFTYQSARTTETSYNAFGDTILQSVYGAYQLANGDTGKTAAANTRYYYNQSGLKKAQINALQEDANGKRGYLTTYTYDGAGNLLTQLESATAITAWDDKIYNTATVNTQTDRSVKYDYDLANHKTKATLVGAQASTGQDIVTSYAYDATGNLTQTTDANGMRTISYYDALGRVIAIAAVASSTLSAGAPKQMPFTELRMDAYGNVVVRIDYAAVDTSSFTATIGKTLATRSASPSSVTANDRVTQTSYDIAGHATKVTDAESNVSYNSYDVYGRLAKHWQDVTAAAAFGAQKETAFQIYGYDALGRLQTLQTPANTNLVSAGTTDKPVNTVQTYYFNAFGEVTRHETIGGKEGALITQTETTDYDNAGHAWRSNAGDGITKVTLFDAQGNATVIMRSSGTGNPLAGIARASEALFMSDIQRTDTRYDMLGHTVDVNTLHGNDLYYLYRQADGSWAKDMLPPEQGDANGFLVIGEPHEASSTFAVEYRLQGSSVWLAAPARVQQVNGYTVFSVSGLTSGTYEYRVTVTPLGETSYLRDGGQLTIQSATSTTKIEQLIRMYQLILGRAPDAEGLAKWMASLNAGTTMAQVASSMLNAATTFGPNDSNDVVLSTIYQNAFGVAPDKQSDVYKNWLARMNQTVVTTAVNPQNPSQIVTTATDSRAQTMADLAQDAAIKARLQPQVDALYNYLVIEGGGIGSDAATFSAQLMADAAAGTVDVIAKGRDKAEAENQRVRIAHIFIGLLGRAAQKDGFDFWVSALTHESAAAVAEEFFGSDEWRMMQPNPEVNAQTNTQLINRVFNNLVGRAPTSDEFTFWSGKLNASPSAAGYVTRGAFVVELSDQIGRYIGTDSAKLQDRANLYNKTVVSLGFAEMPQLTDDVSTLIAVGQALLSGISPNTTVATAVSQVMKYVQAMQSSAAGYTGAATAGALATPLETTQLQLARLYAALLNRAPDNTGFNFWLREITTGNSSFEIFANDTLKTEGAALYPASMTPEAFVQKVYQTAFGVPATDHQLLQWTAELATKSRGAVVLDILSAALGSDIFLDQNGLGYFNSKVGVGLTYALNAGGNNVALATKILGLVKNNGGKIDIAAAMTEVSNATATLALDSARNTAEAANAAAALMSKALAAAQTLSAANSSVTSATTAAAQVPMASYVLRAARLYAAIVNRGAIGAPGLDLDGFTAMARGLATGTTDVSAAQGMLGSAEAQKLFPLTMTGATFVTTLWQLMTTSADLPNGAPLPAADQEAWTTMASSRSQFGATAVAMLNKLLSVEREDINAGASNPSLLLARQGFDTQLASLLAGLRSQADSAAALAANALGAINDAQAKADAATAAANAVTAARAAASSTNSSYVLNVTRLYVGILNRGTGNLPGTSTPRYGLDYGGLLGAALADKQNYPLAIRAQDFINSAEGQKIFGAPGRLVDNATFISLLYQQILGRTPGPDDTFWLNALNGGQTRGTVAAGIIQNLTESTYPKASEFDAAAAFDQRVADALNALNNDPATTTGIAKTNSDVTAASTVWNNALTTLQNADPAINPAVVAAQQAKDYLASPYQTDLIKLLVGLGLPADYQTVANDLQQMKAGTMTFASICGSTCLPLTDLEAFFQDLFGRILHRTIPANSPDRAGFDWWVNSTRQQQQNGNANYSNPGYVAYEFFKGCLVELYGTQTDFPMRQRTGFPTEVNNVVTPNTSKANSLAATYNTALANAQQAQANAQIAFNAADTDLQNKTALNTIAKTFKASLAATITLENNQVTAAKAMSASLNAKDAAAVAQKALGSFANGWTTAQVTDYANGAIGVDNALIPEYNLNTALANAAGASIAVALNAQDFAAAQAATVQVIQAVQVYNLVLNRQPTLSEVNAAMLSLRGGMALPDLALSIMAAYPSLYPASMSNDDFVRLLFSSFNPTPLATSNDGLRFWSDHIGPDKSRGQLAVDLINSLSKENINADSVAFDSKVKAGVQAIAAAAQAAVSNPDVSGFLQAMAIMLRSQAQRADASAAAALTPQAKAAIQMTQLYVTLLGRMPETAGLISGIAQLSTGTPASVIAASILNSAEIESRLSSSLSNADFVRTLYTTGLGRAPDSTELATLSSQLDSGQLTRAQLVLNAIDAMYAYTGGDAAKLEARNVFIGQISAAMGGAADTLRGLNAYFSGSFISTLQTKLDGAVKTYVAGYANGIDSTTTDTVQLHTAANSLEVDRWGNVTRQYDARNRNWYTENAYDDANHLIRSVQYGMVQDINGTATSNKSLTTSATYDKLGHVESTTDAKGYTNKYFYDAQGVLWQEFHADNTSTTVASVVYANDAFGQHTRVTQNVGLNSAGTAAAAGAVLTDYAYDRLGHVKTKTSAAVTVSYYDGNKEYQGSSAIIETYRYDEMGRRVSTAISTSAAITGIPASVNPAIYTRYDLSGNIIATKDGNGLVTTTVYDALNHKVGMKLATGDTQSWDVDAFGRMRSQSDIAGNHSYYEYNASGQLMHQYGDTSDHKAQREDLRYSYEDGTGRLLRIDYRVNQVGAAEDRQVTTYTYDRDGNRTSEKTVTSSGRALQDQVMIYDGFNRLTNIVSRVASAAYNVHYTYDDNGNRSAETTVFVNDRGDKKTITVNYGYDNMNRETSVSGSTHTKLGTPISSSGGTTVIRGNDGANHTIQKEDNRDPVNTFFNDADIPAHSITYDWRGNRINDNGELYKYDLAGRLASITGTDSKVSYRRYDAAGRVVFSSDAANDESRLSQYDAGGRLKVQRIANAANSTPRQTVNYTDYDELNNLLRYTVTLSDGKTGQTFNNTYNAWIGGSRMLDTTAVQNFNSNTWKSSQQNYDVNGNLAAVQQFDDQYRALPSANGLTTLLSDVSGHVLEKTKGNLVTHSLIANDQLIGSSNANMETFSSVYESADAPSVANQPAVYVVQKDTETLMSVAQAIWGDQRLWYLIADANGGIDTALKTGQQLVIPQRMNTIYNGYLSFTPYNKAEAVGDTTPHLEMPPPQASGGGGGCGAIGKLIMVAVAVAVTAMTGGIAGAVMGSISSQLVGMAIGAQDKFSWKGVALSAVSAGVAAGVSELAASGGALSSIGDAQWYNVAARAAVANVATQGIANITGLQQGFSWTSVAASAAGAAAGDVTGGYLKQNNMFASLGDFAAPIARASVTGVAAGLTTAVARGGRIAVTQIATDAFGNALGNSLARMSSDTTVDDLPGRTLQTNSAADIRAAGLRLPGGTSFFVQPEDDDSNSPRPESAAGDDAGIVDLGDGRVRLPNGHIVRPNVQALPFSDTSAPNKYPGYDLSSDIGMQQFLNNLSQRRSQKISISAEESSTAGTILSTYYGLNGSLNKVLKNWNNLSSADASDRFEANTMRMKMWTDLNNKYDTNINFAALTQFEGGQRLDGYVPTKNGAVLGRSGVTIATGFDIGQMKSSAIRDLDLDKALINKLVPYASPMIKSAAIDYLAVHPLEVTRSDAMRIDANIKGMHLASAIESWDNARLASTPAFSDLSSAQQTVIFSRTFHQGVGFPSTDVAQPFYTAALQNRWVDAESALRNYNVAADWYKNRVASEANLLRTERNRSGR